MLKKLGKYELVEEVGRGAMGEVYKANDPLIGRAVALKTITSALVGDPELLDRFYREARSVGALEHPNIVTIYELGSDGRTPFIAMEYLEGETLEKTIQRRSLLTVAEKVGVIVPVCRALDYAHKRGVVHRDIKPGNVMLTKDGKVKVLDFGIARQMNASMTQTNMFMGTLSYMSPQQIYGERADERSDIWALGVTFYELLCYRRPFEGDNHAAVMLSIAEEKNRPEPLTKLVPDCPQALQRLMDRMLEKDVRARFQSMEEVLLDIEPLWQNLQHASVSGLVAESEKLIGLQEFLRARDLLRKALQIDSRNDRAKALLEHASTEVRLIQTKSQVAEILTRAKKLQYEGRFEEAQREAESALSLDSSSAEGRELASEARRQAERKNLVEDGLQVTRQRLAEGALTMALQEIQKVLGLDPDNHQGRSLQKQIQEQLLRREEQKRISDLLQRGRKLWAEQRFDDCVALLTEAQKAFPRDPEIAKFLETATMDRAERQKLNGLAETRVHLANHQFDAALARVQSLTKLYPGDLSVEKLHDLVVQEKQEMLRREKRSSRIAELRSLMSANDFSEAAVRGEKFLQEFSGDSELSDLVSFARGELVRLEQKRKLEEALQGVLKRIEAEQFRSAVTAGEKALARFPGDPAITAVLEQARKKLKEKENRELLQKRVGEIRARINKGQHTDAVDLARQTLATLGHDEQTTHLLRMAEMELAEKREKQEEQEKHLAAAQTIVQEGRFADATQILKGAFETQVLSRRDPRVQELLKKIKAAKAASAAQPAKVDVSAALPLDEPVAAAKPLIEQNQLEHASLQERFAEQDSVVANEMPGEEGFSATLVSSAGIPSQTELAAEPSSAASQSSLQEESLFALDYGEPQETPKAPLPLTARIVQTVSERPIPFATGFVVLVVIVVSLSLYISHRPTRGDFELRAQSQKLEEQKDWPAALAGFEALARTPRSLAGVGRENAARLRRLFDEENSLLASARDSESKDDSSGAMNFYKQVAGLHGDKETLALAAMDRLITPVEPSSRPKTAGKHPPRDKTNPSSKPQTVSKATPRDASVSCQFIRTDVMRHLERAERDLGNGKYDDAERLYNDVLACEPNNDRARSGLDRTRKARAAERNLPPN